MIKLRATGGERVGRGTYWNFRTGGRMRMEAPGPLPGGREITYYRVNPAVMFVAAPVLGLGYALVLPIIGVVMAVSAVTGRIMAFVAAGSSKASTFTWRPREAYLAGRKRKDRKTPGQDSTERPAKS